MDKTGIRPVADLNGLGKDVYLMCTVLVHRPVSINISLQSTIYGTVP